MRHAALGGDVKRHPSNCAHQWARSWMGARRATAAAPACRRDGPEADGAGARRGIRAETRVTRHETRNRAARANGCGFRRTGAREAAGGKTATRHFLEVVHTSTFGWIANAAPAKTAYVTHFVL